MAFDPAAELSLDTGRDAEAHQIEIWNRLSTVELAALVDGASRAARSFALAGLRADYPGASDRELFLRLALLTLGPGLARAVYPDIERLGS
jgi:hypothetical protein